MHIVARRAQKRPLITRAHFLACATLTLASSGCSGFFVDPQLTSISVGPLNPTVKVGNTQQMDATGVYDNKSTKLITTKSDWTSSDDSVATVNSSGLVTGVAIGTSTISAYDSGYSASTTVTVTDASLLSISISPTSPTIDSGKSQQFTATGLLQDGKTMDLTKSVMWASSNTAVATIDSDGLASAASVSSLSTTDITAKSGNITSNVATLTVR